MTPLTQEWVDKAEGDYASALRELRARKSPNYDSACFHAQQCAEKYLKAYLQESNVPFPMTHDLLRLLGLLSPIDQTLSVLQPYLQTLTLYAVGFRYPGNSALKTQAKAAIADCEQTRRTVRARLGLT